MYTHSPRTYANFLANKPKQTLHQYWCEEEKKISIVKRESAGLIMG